MWVSPFRHPRINGYLLLPAAFRSLSRLSSALSAKASTLRSFLLNLHIRCIALHHMWLLLLFFYACFRSLYFFMIFTNLYSASDVFSFCLISIFGFQGTTHRSNELKIKPACIFIFICICIACLHAVSRSQICECGVLATLLETKRFELSTPCLQGRCSPN